MENGKRKMENISHWTNGENSSVIRLPSPENIICSACGTEARRRFARFCRVCGKLLQEDYEPLDTLRSSYRLQGKIFSVESERIKEATNLFAENKNSASETASAFLVYSLVP